MKKKLMLLLLIVAFAGVFFYGAAIAERSTTDGYITWEINNDVLTINGTGPMPDYTTTFWTGTGSITTAPWNSSSFTTVIIGEGVTSVGKCAFYGIKSLTNIEMSNSVTSIGDAAFYNCNKLSSAMIPNSVTSIGNTAFYNCYKLSNIMIPNSVMSIGRYAFYYCSSLTSIEIPNGVTTIEDSAFYNCSGLTSIEIPNSVTHIGSSAFNNCRSLTSIEIPNSVTSIGGSAFYACSKLDRLYIPSVETWLSISFEDSSSCPSCYANHFYIGGNEVTCISIPDGITSIGEYAFYHFSSVTNIEIPNSVTSIGGYAFSGCSSLTTIELPNSIALIGNRTFSNCSSLTSIGIPISVTSIGSFAFSGCSSLTSIEIPDSVTNIGSYAFSECSSLTSIEIPDSVTSIGDYAFSTCKRLISIEIPESVTNIEEYTFNNCSNLRSVIIQEGVESIGRYAFTDCSSLLNVTIPKSITSIGVRAFANCRRIKSISILDGVTSIGTRAFYDCPGILYANIGTDGAITLSKAEYSFRIPGENYDLIHLITDDEITGTEIIKADTNISGCEIPEGVTSIRSRAFYGCSSLTRIYIPDSVKSVGSQAFDNCPAIRYANERSNGAKALSKASYTFRTPEANYDLYYMLSSENEITETVIRNVDKDIETFVVPENITRIGYCCFYGLSNLTSISIPNSVTIIGDSAFYDCSSLTSVEIPNSVTSIEDYAFYNCSGLKSVEIPDGVTNIGSAAFCNCNSLTEIEIPESVTSIGGSAFSCCSNLRVITISGALTRINASTFWHCYKLRSIEIPQSVTSIGDCAFYQCEGLTKVTMPSNLVSIGENAFAICGLTSIEIPGSVKNIGKGAFLYCTSLSKMYISSIDSWLSINFGDAASYPNLYANHLFINGIEISSITIPEGVTSIGDFIFRNCSNLTSVTLPESVTSIGIYAFANCSGLASISIPKGVTNIGDSAFKDCSRLTKVEILSQSISFGSSVFSFSPTIYCYSNSSANSWATSCGYSIINLDTINAETIRIITLPEEMRIAMGDTILISNPAFPLFDNPTIEWCSSDPEIVSVNDGVLIAHSAGTAIITASAGSASDCLNVTVYKPAESFALSETEYWIVAKKFPYNTLQLEPVQIMPIDAELTLDWTSSDYSCASVNQQGLVTALNPGDATIVAVSEKGVRNTCKFHVCNPVTEITVLPTDVEIQPGDDYQITANVKMGTQSCVNHLVMFTSNNPEVAEVNQDGHVQGKRLGIATIMVSGIDNPTIHAEIQIRVGVCSMNDNGPVAHSWGETKYTWNENNTEVTAKRICENNPDHVQEETVDVNCEITKVATCEEKGKTTYTSETFKNKAFTVQNKTLENIPALGHDWGEPTYTWNADNSKVTATRICGHDTSHVETETANTTSEETKAATCEANGETTYTGAAFENMAFTAQMKTVDDIPALGHDWSEPTYTWAADNSKITATRVCGHDASHVETETVNTTFEVTKAATCEANGETTYTGAAFENTAFTAQTKTVDDVPALGHDWSDPAYTWNADNSKVTATRVCRHDASHVETETVNTTSEVTKAATCEANGETTYTGAAFENTTFTAQSKTVDDIPAIGHDWSEPSYTWVADNSKVTATRVCRHDASHVETEAVNATFEVTKAATCEAKGETTYTGAMFENTAFTAQTKTVDDIPAQGHEWDEPIYEWQHNGLSCKATHACIRGDKEESENGAITFEQEQAPTCSSMGKTKYTASFGKEGFTQQTKIIEDIAIDPNAHEWNEPNYEWVNYHTSIIATHTCKHDVSHTETETVSVTSSIVSPDETTEGSVIYTSGEFTKEGFSIQTKEFAIPALENMTVLHLPKQLVTVEDEAFSNLACQAVIIPDGCTSIGENAFAGCVNLRYVQIPASVTSWPESVFVGCGEELVIDWKKE